jgi:hypothetical protein
MGLDCDLCPYMYPPFVAALLAPVSEVPATRWRDVVLVINVSLVFVFAYQIVLLCGAARTWRSFLWALGLVLVCYPLARATKLSQIVPLLAAGFWCGMLWMRRQRDWRSGILMGIVGAIKLFPAALVMLPFLDKRLRLVAITLATMAVIYGASLLALGTQVHGYWWEVMRQFGTHVEPYWGNQSPLGWFARAVEGHTGLSELPFTDPVIEVLRLILLGVFGSTTVWVLWKTRGELSENHVALSSGLLLSGILLSVPISWEHYWLFVLPCLGWAIRDVWLHGDRRFWELWLAAAAFFFTMKLTHFYGDTVFGQVMSGSQTVGMILLWIWFMRRVWRGTLRNLTLSTVND